MKWKNSACVIGGLVGGEIWDPSPLPLNPALLRSEAVAERSESQMNGAERWAGFKK